MLDLRGFFNKIIGRGISDAPRAWYHTEAGISCGPTQYYYNLDCVFVSRAFPQVVLTAVFVRVRFMSKPMAAHMLKYNEDEIGQGLVSIEHLH